MSQAVESARQETSGVHQYLLAAYYLIAQSMSLTTAFIGAILAVFGFLISPATASRINAVLGGYWPSHDVLTAMFVVWGATFVLFGLGVFAILWMNRLYARTVAS